MCWTVNRLCLRYGSPANHRKTPESGHRSGVLDRRCAGAVVRNNRRAGYRLQPGQRPCVSHSPGSGYRDLGSGGHCSRGVLVGRWGQSSTGAMAALFYKRPVVCGTVARKSSVSAFFWLGWWVSRCSLGKRKPARGRANISRAIPALLVSMNGLIPEFVVCPLFEGSHERLATSVSHSRLGVLTSAQFLHGLQVELFCCAQISNL